MGARSRTAFYLMTGRGMSHDAAETMLQSALDEHAHELAEEIRTHDGALNGKEWHDFAADLIDPEVE